MQNAGEGIIVVDGKGNIMLMNPAAEEIYGARLADIAGQPVAAGAGDTRVVALASDLEGSPDKPPSASIQVSGADGVKRTIGASWAVVQNEGGRVVGMVMTLTDLAKHRRLEQAERDFVAHVAHELRSPLSSIQASMDESQKRVMANSLFNTQRLAGLINDILDFSKIESGMMTVRPRRSDARKAASDAVESLGPWAARKQLTLTLSAAPDLPDAQLDPRRTVQVLVNLLSNAIKFTPAGGAVVVGVGRSRTEPDRWLVFGVSDTGPGIPKREQERIFQRFLQLGQGEKHAGAGTGLGLTISKALVEMQGGQLWFESEEGRGTRFYFTLPVFVPEPEGEATPPPPPPPAPWWKRLFGLG
jgi:PAS domain S-box-containing protein